MPGENIQDWSVTAINNGNADSSINWLEGQARQTVNDSARSMMAAHAKERNLTNGSITTGGAVNAYTFTSGIGYTSVPTGLRVLLNFHITNTGPSTLDMDGIGAFPIGSLVSGAMTAGDLPAGYTELIFNGSVWVLIGAGDGGTNKVNVSGDTMTGALTVPGITSTGNVNITGTLGCTGVFVSNSNITAAGNVTGNVLAAGGIQIFGIPTERVMQFSADGWRLSWNPTSGSLTFYRFDAYPLFVADASGNFTITANGWKPGGGVWADASDARIKTVAGDYSAGLDAINALNPVRYSFKGNDGEHTANGKEYIGLIAQDVEAIMPEMVTQKAGQIDGKPVTDLRMLDTGALIYALVNAVQELSERLEALEEKA